MLCDIVDSTLCIDVDKAARLVGPRTRAVIAIDYGCHLYDHAALDDLASTHGLRVIHDAAHSFGAAAGDAMVGSFSDICMFSFDPVKAVSCIDGGILLVRSEEELAQGREMRVLGSTLPVEITYQNARLWNYAATAPGFRYHLSNVHAAIGLAQLGKLDWIRSSRQTACERYIERLGHLDGMSVPAADVSGLNPFLFYVRVAAEVLSLPLHSGMPPAVVDRVCDAAASFFV